MGDIRPLGPDVIDRIAAGEVVERPASAVKELCENSLDAGARAISVEIDGGGLQRIRVCDDGCGMGPDDLILSVARHATSKIASAEDLWEISTMGFRGEALSSIGAVSRLSIESRLNEQGAVEGARIESVGGSVAGPVPAGCAAGTSVTVCDLFFNVPARRKFLRSARVEAGRAVEAVLAASLAFPGVRFDVTVDGARRHSLPACAAGASEAGARARVEAVLGADAVGTLLRVEAAGCGISISGFVSERGRAAGRDVHLYVNRRPVRDRLIMHALTGAFGEMLARGAFPSAVLWIEIDPAAVDVNVHPSKREVKFAEPGAVHSFIASAVKKSLGCAVHSVSGPYDSAAWSAPGAAGRSEPALVPFGRPGPSLPTEASALTQGSFADFETGMRPLGQMASSYIVCEGEAGDLVIIDQHAAHERLGFDSLCAQHVRGPVARQALLIPEQVELAESDAAELAERSGLLAQAGFEIEPFGGGTVMVKAVPALLAGCSVATLMQRIAGEFAELGSQASMDEALRRIFALVACHRQVRAGDPLGPEEVARLVRDVERGDVKTCPHGRPALVRVERAEIEKWFKRS